MSETGDGLTLNLQIFVVEFADNMYRAYALVPGTNHVVLHEPNPCQCFSHELQHRTHM